MPSGPRATPELLFTPLFFTPSVGGGIDNGTGVPPAAGVLALESRDISTTAELVGVAITAAVGVGSDSFDGDSSLTATGREENLCSPLGETFNVTSSDFFLVDDDFRRALRADAAFGVESIMMFVVQKEDGREG